MMRIKRTLSMAGASAALAFSLGTSAYAAPVVNVTVNFDAPALAGTLYASGESFAQSYFRMTAVDDFGTVDNTSGLSNAKGNYYSNFNDGMLRVEQQDGKAFNFFGFSAGFIPLNPASTQETFLIAYGLRADGSDVGIAWQFAPSGFATYSNPLDFNKFGDLVRLDFFTCSYDGTNFCTQPTLDNGQFAVDDLKLSFIPEPSSMALVFASMFGLGFSARRNRKQS